MRQRFRFRLAERGRHLRRILAIWRSRDPKPWVVALVAVGVGFSLFLVMLAWVGVLRLLSHVAKWLR